MNVISNNARRNRLAALNTLEERKRDGRLTPRNVRPLFTSSRSGY